MRRILTTVLLAISLANPALATQLEFSAQRPEFRAAAGEYAAIWAADGERIVATLDTLTRAKFPEERVKVIVFEDVSNSGTSGEPMYLRASYPLDVKRATVVHELAHRYVDALDLQRHCFKDVHELLSLVLLEAWTDLWGVGFAKAQAAVESKRSNRYRRAWEDVLELPASARQVRLERMLQSSCAVGEHASDGPDA